MYEYSNCGHYSCSLTRKTASVISTQSSKMFLEMNLFFIFLIFFQYCYASEVTIEDGTLIGKTFSSRSGRQYHGFLSIPYAKPPVGDLRFEPPQPPEHWNGLRNVTQPPVMCIQKDSFTYLSYTSDAYGEEDCLYLNVFTTKITNDRLFPVMFWIPGGGFVNGQSSWYDPTYFMDHDVVVVTIQYRLEILGFLTTLDDILPGNLGMKDQVMALKWVQKNIEIFGGDPNKVTIFGQSAGAVSVHFHMYSPLSAGLFHRAIAQSGSALASWVYLPRKMARERIITFGVLTGCPSDNSREFVNCLKKVPAKELIEAHWKFYLWCNEPMNTFRIVSEPKTVRDAFLYENPWGEAEVNQVPLMTGINSAEGAFKVARLLHKGAPELAHFNDNYERRLPVSFFYGGWYQSTERVDQITKSLKKFYFGDKDISVETESELVDLYGDGWFLHDVMTSAKRRRNTTTFFYYYDHINEHSFVEVLGKTEKILGACHGDELISLFKLNGLFPPLSTSDDFEVSERMVKYWVNFASTGKPDSSDVWTPIKSDDVEYLHITTKKDEMKKGLLKDRFQFWRNLKINPPLEKEDSREIHCEL